MAVSLTKGQKVSLSKETTNLEGMVVGLGWDVKTGLFGGRGDSYDLDASIIALRNGKYTKKDDLVYFGNKRGCKGAIQHCGDNLTGEGDGDDEQIIVNLDSMPSDVDKLVVIVTIYNGKRKGQDFGRVKNAFVRICSSNGTEILRYNLTENYSGVAGMIFGEIYRHNGEWKFNPIGEGVKEDSIAEIAKRYA